MSGSPGSATRPPIPLPTPRSGEVAVIGLGASGQAVARLLRRHGHAVYASDAGSTEKTASAAASLAALGAAVDTGTHDLDRIARAALVVASPGVPPTAAPLVAATAAGVPVVGELDIALRAMPKLKYVAVTGTNGKTTTTAIIGHLLRALGHDAPDAGNIGTPLATYAAADAPPPWAALETSSFQLHDTPGINPTVGVITNLSPDHLDRYPDIGTYYADKARMFANAHAQSLWVLNADDAEVLRLHERLERGTPLAGRVLMFSLHEHRGADAFLRADGTLDVLGAPLMTRAAFPLVGDHNVANALAAVLAVMVADPAHRSPKGRKTIAAALQTFHALPHRLEPVGDFAGVRWINDSKATNVASTQVALEGMRQPTVVLLGGRHKGDPYTSLIPALKRCARLVIAYGEAAPLIEADLGTAVPFARGGSSFVEVVAQARAAAQPGDVVLLSPACSSYDMFANYDERGATFRRLAAAGADLDRPLAP